LLSQHLHDARWLAGLTQEALADLVPGADAPMISRLENGLVERVERAVTGTLRAKLINEDGTPNLEVAAMIDRLTTVRAAAATTPDLAQGLHGALKVAA
jgi:DNA-binding XRE family transcriptional regulator